MANGAMIGVMAASAAAARARADVLRRFRVADATAPDRGQSLASLGLRPEGAAAQLMAAGLILPGQRADRFYVSEAAVAADEAGQAAQRRTVALVLAVGSLLLAGAVAFAAYSGFAFGVHSR